MVWLAALCGAIFGLGVFCSSEPSAVPAPKLRPTSADIGLGPPVGADTSIVSGCGSGWRCRR